ncbi:MAG: DUF411 domain-containing protein [Rhodomicrobiaceae bacterium]
MLTRRSFIAICAFAGAGLIHPLHAETLPAIKVHKDPSCGCCGAWVDHLRAAGFTVAVDESSDLPALKQQLGVPAHLSSCHTAEIAGYVVEGHVPAAAISRLLKEKPVGRGLAVPGMPIGSPGMEVEGADPEAYDVVLFGAQAESVFARFRGTTRI